MAKYIVTSALPYSNGELHIGHIAGAYLPADIFVRFLKLKDQDVLYFCGTDEYGAPISIKAESEGVSTMDIVNRYHKSIYRDFKGVGIDFHNFSGTARVPHQKISQKFFLNLLESEYIKIIEGKQFYCKHDKRFLADRYVDGICPFCKKEGARGDQCDACGKLMETLTLIQPKCKICGNTPIIKSTKHWFLDLPKFSPKLKAWIETKTYWKENIRKFILGLLDEGLIERAITRDTDWGIPVPLEEAKDKVLYVWFDAPIGYLSSCIEYFDKIGKKDGWKKYWLNQKTKLIHFIGKDNNIFHALFWPAVLMGQKEKFILPHDIPANEFLNLEGEKLSTSKNWAIWVGDFLKEFDGELLRYYLARIAPENKDSDFYWKDFQTKINSELANVLGNLANRIFLFAKKYFDGKIEKPNKLSKNSKTVLANVEDNISKIEENYFQYKVRANTTLIMDIARAGNKYFDESAPWSLVKNNREKTGEILYVCTELLRIISITLTPIMPISMQKLRKMMGLDLNISWNDLKSPIQTVIIKKTFPLFMKIEDKKIEKQILALKSGTKKEQKNQNSSEVSFEEFSKIKIKIAKIISAEKIKKSSKLLKLQVDLGDEKRQVIAGIKKDYEPTELIGKKVALLCNLAPRKIMGEISQGMVLAAADDKTLALLVPDKDVKVGSRVS